jgi:hypothetical protein
MGREGIIQAAATVGLRTGVAGITGGGEEERVFVGRQKKRRSSRSPLLL